VYRFQGNALDGNQTIRYSASRSRYVRVRLLHGAEMLPLRGIDVIHDTSRQAERVLLDVRAQPDPTAPTDESWWLADFGEGRLPVSEVRLSASQTEFHRAVRVRLSEDGNVWRTVGFGDIYRTGPELAATETADIDSGSERLSVRVPEAQARFWRVELIDRDDPQLTDVSVQLLGTPRRVVFAAEPERSYRLLMGHPRAAAVYYQRARLVPEGELEAAIPATLGPVAANTTWADPAPWTERNPYLVWILLLLGIAVVIAGLMRVLRR
jgi:hypothetical protein